MVMQQIIKIYLLSLYFVTSHACLKLASLCFIVQCIVKLRQSILAGSLIVFNQQYIE